MPEWLRLLLGEVTANELLLVGLLFLCVLAFSGAPALGEAVGGLFDEADDGNDER